MPNEMTKAIQRIKTLCGSHSASIYAKWLSAAQTWENSAALFRSVGQAAEKGTLDDHLAALRYALVFRSLGFLLSFEPTGSKGPDLLILRDAAAATVEITRFRPMNPGPPVLTKEEYLQDDFLLEPYGNPQRDIVKCLEKVRDKLRQAVGARAIIAVWNNDEALEEVEMRDALRDLQRDPGLPAGLQMVLYGSEWAYHGQQLWCFPMKAAVDAHVQQWAYELEAVSVTAAVASALAMGAT